MALKSGVEKYGISEEKLDNNNEEKKTENNNFIKRSNSQDSRLVDQKNEKQSPKGGDKWGNILFPE